MLNYVITVAISVIFVPHYLSIFWEPLRTTPWDVIVGIAFTWLLVGVNIIGIQEAARLNIALAVLDFATQLVLVVLGFFLIFSPHVLSANIHWGVAPTWRSFALAIPVAMIAYTGIETVSNLAEEARDPLRSIPRAISWVAIAVFAIYFTLPWIALSAMPVVKQGAEYVTPLGQSPPEGFKNDPVLGLVENLGLHGAVLSTAKVYVGILAATILFIATNAGMIGVSRLTYSMGQYRQLPERLRALHPRFRTPYVAIVVFGLVACLTILPGQAQFLGTIYAFGAMLSFTIAHLSVIALRLSDPERERPYRGPGRIRIRGRELPLFAIVGALGTGSAWIVVTVLNVETLVAGAIWLAIGISTYVVFRRQQGLSLTETHKIVTPQPVVEHEVEYESILVAFEDNQYSAEAVSTAVRLAARRRRGIHVLVTITVPPNSPIDAEMPEQEARASSIVDSARVRGGRRVTGHWEKVRPGQAGRRVVEEAKDIRARAVVMPLPPRRAGASLFGRTLETVLAERPCRVIIESDARSARESDRQGDGKTRSG